LRICTINSASFADGELAAAVEALRAGRVIAYPTDTLYGLGADPRSGTAVEAIFRIKGRAPGQALPLIAADVTQVASIARLSGPALRLAIAFWPGPLTLVLEAIALLAAGVATGDGTVAIRVPSHAVARAIARVFAHPITATSANRSGEPPTADAADVVARLADSIGVIVDAGQTPGGAPSTIVDVTGVTPRLVRDGAVAWNRVLESLE
jgi:L-threonylcarbamoyladenylate synthase